MNVLSLFDGISCGMVALEKAGIKPDRYFASEIDKNAIAISKKNYPQIIQLGNVMEWETWELPKIDLIIGGSPCQAFSRAGGCLNFDDPRGQLFFKFETIYKRLRQQNPNIKVLFENVEMKNEWKDVISNHLELSAVLINSNLLTAQNRPRLYWTNIPFEYPKDKGICLRDILSPGSVEYTEHNGVLIDKTIDANAMGIVYRGGNGEIRIKQATKQGYIVAHEGDGINLQFPKSRTRRGRVINQKSPTLDTQCDVCVLENGHIRRLNIGEIERLQTLPTGYTDGFCESVSRKAIGNGWSIDIISHIFRGLKDNTQEGAAEQ